MPAIDHPSSGANRSCLAVVLAAGEGTRMRSSLPKVLHKIGGRTMLGHVLATLSDAGAGEIAVVVGPGRDDVAREALAIVPAAGIAVQTERLGTAHAVLAAKAYLAQGMDDVLVVFADTPLVTAGSLSALRDALATGAGVAVLGFEAANPHGYGRLLRDAAGSLAGIVEEKDATSEQRAVTLCNAGLMALAGKDALALLEAVSNANAKKEFYLTDVVAIARQRGLATAICIAPEQEVMGVNDRIQLAQAEGLLQNRLRAACMSAGVTLQSPETTFLSADTKIAQDVTIEPHVVIGPGVTIESGALIHAFSHLEGAHVGPNVSIGPYARLRPGAKLEQGAKIGNFVEIKASIIGAGAKVNHLSYVGDASVGPRANIGAGVVTCNYDGFSKFKTQIGADAFVGTNSSLVAPITIGDNAYVGSGSVITNNVEPGALAVGRARQITKAGWSAAMRAKKAKPAAS